MEGFPHSRFRERDKEEEEDEGDNIRSLLWTVTDAFALGPPETLKEPSQMVHQKTSQKAEMLIPPLAPVPRLMAVP